MPARSVQLAMLRDKQEDLERKLHVLADTMLRVRQRGSGRARPRHVIGAEMLYELGHHDIAEALMSSAGGPRR